MTIICYFNCSISSLIRFVVRQYCNNSARSPSCNRIITDWVFLAWTYSFSICYCEWCSISISSNCWSGIIIISNCTTDKIIWKYCTCSCDCSSWLSNSSSSVCGNCITMGSYAFTCSIFWIKSCTVFIKKYIFTIFLLSFHKNGIKIQIGLKINIFSLINMIY